MLPSHNNDVGTTNLNASKKATNSSNSNTPIASPKVPSENGVKQKSITNGTTTTTTTKQNDTTNLHNGVSSINGNANLSSYQNGNRRDSTQIWTPLLPNGNGTTSGATTDEKNVCLSSGTTVLYGPHSNNNEWKDAEDINNFKNGLLQNTLHHNNHHNHHNNHQGNNNGSLINGKNGINHLGHDKYSEQDPLTGLYNQKKKKTHPSESEESDFDPYVSGGAKRKTPTCGLFGCRPKWARSFASTHAFMVVFLLAYILQGMYMTYFVSVITTIEKLFQIKSKTTGFLLSASEMGQISTAMLLTYFAGRGHRPRWIACGMVLFSIAAFLLVLPHFIFGNQLIQSSAFLNSGNGGNTVFNKAIVSGQMSSMQPENLLNNNSTMKSVIKDSLISTISSLDSNLCLTVTDNATVSSSECNEDRQLEQASHSKITNIVLCIFFGSLLSTGIGQTAVATLGIPYIDDNVASKQSPMYMAITIGVRILGPASGFIVGSFCTRWFVNFTNPGFNASDPRWIGAWWLGPVIIGSLMLISSIAMFSFPKELRGKRNPNAANTTANGTSTAVTEAEEEKPKLKDFPKTVRRQLSNDILMFRTASCVFHLLPIAGLYTFLPKYLETQFRLATYDANMIAALCGILVMGFGIVISGLVILKLRPSAKSVAAWIAVTALIYSAGMVVLMFMGCSMNDFAGYRTGSSSAPALIEPACNAALNCTCDKTNFAPICGVDGKIYISSCHAGCTSTDLRVSDNRTVYSNCGCIPDSISENDDVPYEAVGGYCDSNCKNFIPFILIFAVCVFMHSTSEVGSMLLVMRCTHPKDKAMAMGVIQSAIGLFGNVPCPIIYGAIVDSACLIWKTVCGKHGACSLYDASTFRHYFLGITAGIMFLAFIMDLVVWSKADRIDIAPEDDNEHKTIKNDCKKAMAAPDTSV